MEIYAKGIESRQLNEIIRGCKDDKIVIRGVNGQRFIACGLDKKDVTAVGTIGNGAGAYMQGGVLRVEGSAQDATGDTMNGGEIYVGGRCGDAAGYAMRGGRIFIKGDVGYRAGVHMKQYGEHKPVIVVGGTAGCFLGEYLAGGVIVVLNTENKENPVGEDMARGMHGGRIYIRGRVTVPLPVSVTARKAGSEDMLFIKPYLESFCIAFGGSIKELMNDEFTLILPAAGNPYKRLYVHN